MRIDPYPTTFFWCEAVVSYTAQQYRNFRVRERTTACMGLVLVAASVWMVALGEHPLVFAIIAAGCGWVSGATAMMAQYWSFRVEMAELCERPGVGL